MGLLRALVALAAQALSRSPPAWRAASAATAADGWLATYAAPGPYPVCFANSSQLPLPFSQPAGWRLPPFSALVVYPCAAAGGGGGGDAVDVSAVLANPAVSGGAWPALAFGIGYQGWPGRYVDTLAHVASHGFLIVAPRTLDLNPVPVVIWQHQQALLLSLAWLAQALPGRVDLARCGVWGHSMGAGDAVVAAALSSNATFARAADSPPGWNLTARLLNEATAPLPAVRAYVALGVPPEDAPLPALRSLGSAAHGLYVAGTGDTFAPLLWQRLAYGLAAGPHTLAVINGGTHCYLDLGQNGFPPSECYEANAFSATLLGQADQLWLARALAAAHFVEHLSGNATAAAAAAAVMAPAALMQHVPLLQSVTSSEQ